MTDKAWLSRSSYVYDCSTIKEGIVHHRDEEEGVHSFRITSAVFCFLVYRSRVQSLAMLVTHSLTDWLTHSLTHSCLVNWRVKMPTLSLLTLLLLLMLMLRIMLATVCYRFGSWRLVLKLNFCPYFEHKGWSRFWSWSLGEILNLEFVQHFAVDVL